MLIRIIVISNSIIKLRSIEYVTLKCWSEADFHFLRRHQFSSRFPIQWDHKILLSFNESQYVDFSPVFTAHKLHLQTWNAYFIRTRIFLFSIKGLLYAHYD